MICELFFVYKAETDIIKEIIPIQCYANHNNYKLLAYKAPIATKS